MSRFWHLKVVDDIRITIVVAVIRGEAHGVKFMTLLPIWLVSRCFDQSYTPILNACLQSFALFDHIEYILPNEA